MKILLLFLSLFGTALSGANTTNPFSVRMESAHSLTVLNHGLASFEARLKMVESAKKTIDVEYFYYHTDHTGKIFNQALIKAAGRGVKIRILLDHMLTIKEFTPFHAYELSRFGIAVKYYNPYKPLVSKVGNHRNHRKFLIVDGESAMTGGRNIGDEYFDLHHKLNFYDRDIIVKGPIISYVQKTFDEFWNSPLSIIAPREEMPVLGSPTNALIAVHDRKLEEWKKNVERARDFFNQPEQKEAAIRSISKAALEKEWTGNCDNISFLSDLPRTSKDSRPLRVLNTYIARRIEKADRKVLIEMPYFISTPLTKSAMEKALDKHRDVTLITNSMYSTDSIYVYAVFNRHIEHWLKLGLRSYIFRGELMADYPVIDRKTKARFGVHGKSIIMDDEDVITGSFNLDPRSANINAEDIFACEDNRDLAKAIGDDIKRHIIHSVEIDSKETAEEVKFLKVGPLKKMLFLGIEDLSNWLDHQL